MFPQLGAPIGFLCSTGVFLMLGHWISEAQFFAWGWRVPFLASAVLVLMGLYIRLRLEETPAFQQAMHNNERERLPMLTVLIKHTRVLLMGTASAITTFVVFYLMTVFALSWGTTALGYSRQEFLVLQMIAVFCFGVTIPLSAALADRYSRRAMLMLAAVLVMLFGVAFEPLFGSGSKSMVLLFLCLGMGLMGLTYGPVGTSLAELFPTAVRYTGASLTFNLAGILGASLAPYIATWLAKNYGLAYVGYYMATAALITLLALAMIGNTGATEKQDRQAAGE
jgi:MFS family permease